MKYLRFALVFVVSSLALLRAQDDQQENQKPPTEIPDFSNLDEYIYEPQSTVKLGFRHLSGAKSIFSGTGTIAAPETLTSDITTANIARVYHDGAVNPDLRTTPRLDSSGNPVIDPQSGSVVNDPITPDGKTNNWSYSNSAQLGGNVPNGYIAFHSYSADVIGTGPRRAEGKSSSGFDLSVSHDMGKLFGGRVTWQIMGGVSINDISAKKTDQVTGTLHTRTDIYALNGTPPAPPYTAPSTASQTVTDGNGNAVTNADGSTQTITVDTTVLIGNVPSASMTIDTANFANIKDNWKVRGAYYTFRFGPEIMIPIGSHFHFDISVGAALAYAGTTYTVTQDLTPDIGSDILDTESTNAYKLRPGYYADASMEYDITDKAGFFAGAVFQSTGSYTQGIHSTTANYVSKIDLTNQNGLRAGMSVRF